MATVSAAGSYEQYKLDTNRFIFWLVDMAQKREYNIEDPAKRQDTTSQQPSKRLKGKERKQARQAATSKAPSSIATSTASKTKYEISTETILKLAKHIADHKDTSTMPKFVWYSYKRAVRTRQAYADRYAHEELSETKSNDGHVYFLWLLKYCHKILEKNIKVQSVGRPVTATPAQLRYSIATAPILHPVPTSVLQAVDTSQDIMAEEAAATEAEQEAAGHKLDELARKFELDMKVKHDNAETELEIETKAKAEFALRKYCLVDDMHTIIKRLESDWNDTNKAVEDAGYLDGIRATLMTEAAFDLIRHKEEVLVQEAHEKGLHSFDPSLDTDEFFGKTARSLKKIEAERRRSNAQHYLFLASHLSAQDTVMNLHSNEDYDFLVHYLFEAGLEQRVRERHESNFKMPLLEGALDAPSRMYGLLGTYELVSMVTTFAAELAMRIRSKNIGHSMKYYGPLSIRAAKEEKQFVTWHDQKIAFPENIWKVVESAHAHRSFIIGRPFSQIRYIEMRMLTSMHPLYGLQHDYPEPKFKTTEARDEFMKDLENKGIEDHPGNTLARQAFATQYILPPQDGDFLRMTIPTLTSKLSLVHLLLREEMGLGFANLSPQIFAMCHLYNCFLKRGLITGSWPEIELMMDWHLEKIFLKEVPNKPGDFYSRLLLAAGFGTKFIKQTRERNKNLHRNIDYGKATHKTSELEPLPMTKILRDYVHKRDTGVRSWYRMDEEMAKHSGNSSRTQGTGDLNILSFIKGLRDSEQLPQLLQRLEFDYIGLTLQCNELCHQIDVEQGKLFGGIQAQDEAHWKSPTNYGFMLVATLLGDLDRIFLEKERDRKGSKHLAHTTAAVDAAVRVMQDFLDGS